MQLGSTSIDFLDLSDAEQSLFTQAYHLSKSLEHRELEDLTETEIHILETANKRLMQRACDLFTNYHIGFLGISKKPLLQYIFHMRFLWFLQEIGLQIRQQRLEDIIMEDETTTECEKEKLLKQLDKKWQKPFTPKSFNELWERAPSPFKVLTDKDYEETEKRVQEAEAKAKRCNDPKCKLCHGHEKRDNEPNEAQREAR